MEINNGYTSVLIYKKFLRNRKVGLYLNLSIEVQDVGIPYLEPLLSNYKMHHQSV